MEAARAPPPCIADLPSLQRACFLDFLGDDGYADDALPLAHGALPDGPWSASLRQLGASYSTLLLSGPLLAAAGQLEQLGVFKGGLAAEPSDASERFWRWCAAHPPLRELHIEMARYRALPSPSFMAAVEALQAARPALQVHHHVGSSPFSDAFHLNWTKY